MKTLLRIVTTVVSALASFFFMYWMGGAFLVGIHLSLWPAGAVVATAVAAWVARYVWKRTAATKADLGSSILLGALVLGSIGFSAGFFGPIYLTPDANQGPLLGIFFTGPLGFLLGGIGGAVYWFASGFRAAKP